MCWSALSYEPSHITTHHRKEIRLSNLRLSIADCRFLCVSVSSVSLRSNLGHDQVLLQRHRGHRDTEKSAIGNRRSTIPSLDHWLELFGEFRIDCLQSLVLRLGSFSIIDSK